MRGCVHVCLSGTALRPRQIYLNDLDVSADYIERLLDETRNALPQVFLEPELSSVREELGTLGELSNRFRATCKVS
jgi:hypothetical protein